MAGKPRRKSRSKVPEQTSKAVQVEPPLALGDALNDLRGVCVSASQFIDLAESRRQASDLHLRNLNVLAKQATRRANERSQAGATPLEVMSELGGLDKLADAPPHFNEPAEFISHLRDVLQRGKTAGDRVRDALRIGAAAWLDAALKPNSAGQPRSIELRTKVMEVESVFSSLDIWLSNPRVQPDNDPQNMATLGKWFGGARNEVMAVLETRGLMTPERGVHTMPTNTAALRSERVAQRRMELSSERVAHGAAARDSLDKPFVPDLALRELKALAKLTPGSRRESEYKAAGRIAIQMAREGLLSAFPEAETYAIAHGAKPLVDLRVAWDDVSAAIREARRLPRAVYWETFGEDVEIISEVLRRARPLKRRAGNEQQKLNDKQREALNHIRSKPGISGKDAAKALGVTDGHFRRSIVSALRPHGLVNRRNGTGYFIEVPKPT